MECDQVQQRPTAPKKSGQKEVTIRKKKGRPTEKEERGKWVSL
jgi:hypothetical protein